MKLVKNYQYVICLANELNFSTAAQKLCIAQSSLTIAVQKVEEDLGFTIFDRSTNPISLTLSGKKYVEFIRKFVVDNNEIVQQCIDLENGNIELIKIGIPHSITTYIGSKVSKFILQKNPELKLEIIERSSNELVELLKNGDVDAIITTLTSNFNETLDIVYSKKEAFNLIVKKNGEFDKICAQNLINNVVKLKQISSLLPFISLGDNQTLTKQVSKVFDSLNIKFMPKIKTSCIQSGLALVKEDLGVLIAPYSYRNYSDLKNQCNFYEIYENKDELSREIVCAIRKNQYISKPINDIITCLNYLD